MALKSKQEFLENFVPTDIANDPIPLKVTKSQLLSSEAVGHGIQWASEYLIMRGCPLDLNQLALGVVREELQKSLKTYREKDQEGQDDIAPLQLMQQTVKIVDEFLSKFKESDESLGITQDVPDAGRTGGLDEVSYFGMKNGRRVMEDKFVVLPALPHIFKLNHDLSYFAVFDGHNGIDAVSYGAAQLHQFMIEGLDQGMLPGEALKYAFNNTDKALVKKVGVRGGTTATVVLLSKEKIYVAWVGDCLASIHFGDNKVKQLIKSHKAERADEIQRVKAMGGEVTGPDKDGMYRVNGVLAITRALGNLDFKECIISCPEIIEIDRAGLDEDYIVLASDGLWDAFTHVEVGKFVNNLVVDSKIAEAAKLLAKEAPAKGSTDNVTVLVIPLRPTAEIASRIASRSTEVMEHEEQLGKHYDTYDPATYSNGVVSSDDDDDEEDLDGGTTVVKNFFMAEIPKMVSNEDEKEEDVYSGTTVAKNFGVAETPLIDIADASNGAVVPDKKDLDGGTTIVKNSFVVETPLIDIADANIGVASAEENLDGGTTVVENLFVAEAPLIANADIGKEETTANVKDQQPTVNGEGGETKIKSSPGKKATPEKSPAKKPSTAAVGAKPKSATKTATVVPKVKESVKVTEAKNSKSSTLVKQDNNKLPSTKAPIKSTVSSANVKGDQARKPATTVGVKPAPSTTTNNKVSPTTTDTGIKRVGKTAVVSARPTATARPLTSSKVPAASTKTVQPNRPAPVSSRPATTSTRPTATGTTSRLATSAKTTGTTATAMTKPAASSTSFKPVSVRPSARTVAATKKTSTLAKPDNNKLPPAKEPIKSTVSSANSKGELAKKRDPTVGVKPAPSKISTDTGIKRTGQPAKAPAAAGPKTLQPNRPAPVSARPATTGGTRPTTGSTAKLGGTRAKTGTTMFTVPKPAAAPVKPVSIEPEPSLLQPENLGGGTTVVKNFLEDETPLIDIADASNGVVVSDKEGLDGGTTVVENLFLAETPLIANADVSKEETTANVKDQPTVNGGERSSVDASRIIEQSPTT